MNRRLPLLCVLIATIAGVYLLMRPSRTNSADTHDKNEPGEGRADATLRWRPKRPGPPAKADELHEPIPTLNAVTSTNLEDWKTAVPALEQIEIFSSEEEGWVMDALKTKLHIPVYLESESNSFKLETAFISIDAQKGTGRIRQLDLHTPEMNMEELRPFGIQLHKMLRVDPQGFIEWCDKVGNTSLDAPLYSSGSGHSPDPAKTVGFRVLNTFDDVKPWFVIYSLADK